MPNIKMTHPDILKAEALGTDFIGAKRKIGICKRCGAEICKDDLCYIETYDFLFCNEECFFDYYGAEVKNNG